MPAPATSNVRPGPVRAASAARAWPAPPRSRSAWAARTGPSVCPVSAPTGSVATSPVPAPAWPATRPTRWASAPPSRRAARTGTASAARTRPTAAARAATATARAAARSSRPAPSASSRAARAKRSSSRPACATARASASSASRSPARPRPARPGACLSSCTGNDKCMAPNSCVDGSCGPKGIGQDCMGNTQCASGFCVDGVCCENACEGKCKFCASPEARGKCTNVRANVVDQRAARGERDPAKICVAQDPAPAAPTAAATARAGASASGTAPSASPPRCNATANNETPAAVCTGGACRVPSARSLRALPGLQRQRLPEQLRQRRPVRVGQRLHRRRLRQEAERGGLHQRQPVHEQHLRPGSLLRRRRATAPASPARCPGRRAPAPTWAQGGADPTGMCRDDACSNGCDGNGGCRRERGDGTVTCGAATCNGNSRVTRVCNASGACESRTTACGTGFMCAGGSCVASPKGNGEACVANGECQSRLCINNVCCATACNGDCKECQAGSGTCGNRGGGCGNGGTCMARDLLQLRAHQLRRHLPQPAGGPEQLRHLRHRLPGRADLRGWSLRLRPAAHPLRKPLHRRQHRRGQLRRAAETRCPAGGTCNDGSCALPGQRPFNCDGTSAGPAASTCNDCERCSDNGQTCVAERRPGQHELRRRPGLLRGHLLRVGQHLPGRRQPDLWPRDDDVRRLRWRVQAVQHDDRGLRQSGQRHELLGGGVRRRGLPAADVPGLRWRVQAVQHGVRSVREQGRRDELLGWGVRRRGLPAADVPGLRWRVQAVQHGVRPVREQGRRDELLGRGVRRRGLPAADVPGLRWRVQAVQHGVRPVREQGQRDELLGGRLRRWRLPAADVPGLRRRVQAVQHGVRSVREQGQRDELLGGRLRRRRLPAADVPGLRR